VSLIAIPPLCDIWSCFTTRMVHSVQYSMGYWHVNDVTWHEYLAWWRYVMSMLS